MKSSKLQVPSSKEAPSFKLQAGGARDEARASFNAETQRAQRGAEESNFFSASLGVLCASASIRIVPRPEVKAQPLAEFRAGGAHDGSRWEASPREAHPPGPRARAPRPGGTYESLVRIIRPAGTARCRSRHRWVRLSRWSSLPTGYPQSPRRGDGPRHAPAPNPNLNPALFADALRRSWIKIRITSKRGEASRCCTSPPNPSPTFS